MKIDLFGLPTKTIVFLLGFATCNMGCSDEVVIKEDVYVKDTEGVFPDYGEVLAFPGAEGYGRKTTGGRGGEVYHVTNLNDSGEGSLRDAVSKPNRIIIFDVSGIVRLESALVINQHNLTIAAQTAPGDGIVLYGDRVSFSGAKNLICRYLRIRMGMNGPKGKDAAGLADGTDMIFDHLSVTWGRDENFSINAGGKADNITIQNSIIGQGLQNHSCGGLIQTDVDHGITLYRNLYIDNKTRNPKVKGLNQFVNNVVYNWGNGAAYNMGGDSEGESETTIEDNYFIVGLCNNWMNVRNEETQEIELKNIPVTPTPPFIGANRDYRAYFKGNYYDYNKDGVLNGIELTENNYPEFCEKETFDEETGKYSGMPTFLSTPSIKHNSILGQTSAEEAYKWVVKYVGACLPVRDEVDAYLIDELTSLGIKGTIIQDERDKKQYPLGGPGKIMEGEKAPDTDGDGMPDSFEEQYGLDKNDPTDASMIANNGYTNIENYIFTLDTQVK